MKHRGRRAGIIGCLVTCLIAFSTAATTPNATGSRPEPQTPPGRTVRVLQLNLCSSGFAACYTGRSTAEAAAVIRNERPDLVTLNEVCRDDVSTLRQALGDVVPGGAVTSAFRSALDRRTGDAFRCRNGQQYGIGLLSRWPSANGSAARGGIYPTQDGQSAEGRAWLCLDTAAGPAIAVCTTHLTHTGRAVAGGQCRYLFGTVIAEMRARRGMEPVVVGGDLNLGPSDDPDLESCLPAASTLADDNDVQHVVGTPEFVVDSSRTIDLHGTSDHPALLVALGVTTRSRDPHPGSSPDPWNARSHHLEAVRGGNGRAPRGAGPGAHMFRRLRDAVANRMPCRGEDPRV